MKPYINTLKKTNLFSSIDLHFAEFIGRHSKDQTTILAGALLSRSVQQGHICFSIAEMGMERITLQKGQIEIPTLEKWVRTLETETDAVSSAEEARTGKIRPIVLDGDSLFLHRYFSYEESMIQNIQKFTAPLSLSSDEQAIVQKQLQDPRIFEDEPGAVNWQKVAAFNAVKNRFSVISGGPGTGKTTTLAKILCILYEVNPSLNIALAAPTGKAAARMGEAVKNIKKELIDEIPEMAETINRIPEDSGSTLHRLLGTQWHSEQFKFNRENRLPHDLIIVDECSMISVPLMSKLLEALKDSARLILLGDKDQLASVEAGRCFGDICESSAVNAFPKDFIADFRQLSGEELPHHEGGRSIVQLMKSYRFPDDSMVGRISVLINKGDAHSADKALELAKHGVPIIDSEKEIPVTWHESRNRKAMQTGLAPIMAAHFRKVSDAVSPLEALNALEGIRVLACIKESDFGVVKLNAEIERILDHENLINMDGIFYENRPVMILKNDYSLKLFNGDIGIVRNDDEGNRRVYFPAADQGEVRSFPPSLLPVHETVYAMTIHKSQGSEFHTVVIVLPSKDTPVLTRELLYTGITRAKGQVEIFGTDDIFTGAVIRKVTRTSGWRKKLG